MSPDERALDRGLNQAAGERSLPWHPTPRELVAPAIAVLLGLAFTRWFSAGHPDSIYVLAGPWSGEWANGLTPSPIIAIALTGGAVFWVLFAFYGLPRWDSGSSFFRSAALTGLAMAWVLVGFLELVLAG